MSGYEKQGWQSEYAAPQGQGGYQQQPQYQQQGWNQQQQPYPPQQGGYQQAPPYAPQQGYGAPPPQGAYGAPPPQQNYGAPPPQQGYGAPPPQGQYSSPPPQGQYGAPPPQQQWGAPPPHSQYGEAPQRHSVIFKFTGDKKTILHSQVMDPYGKSPFTVVSDKKHTTVRAADGTTLAAMDWDHSSPVMHYQGQKLRCKEWIPYHKETQSRTLTHAGKKYNWVTRNETSFLEPSDRPGFPVVIWRDPTGQVEVEAFQEALVVPGLLEAAIISVVIMQSGHPIGDVAGKGGSGINLGIILGGSLGASGLF
ncbi:hypothetical protein BC834DRAFT_824458 [Gloeopeniophorella convolvens]|nr:hypothetical protein BC834DRAFT_824458 [Gloeopeniophorella convolvens]